MSLDDEKVLRGFGRRLRELRTLRKISQEDLAHSAGLDRSYVGQVERGERNISLLNIFKLAEGLKVLPSSLLEPALVQPGDQDVP